MQFGRYAWIRCNGDYDSRIPSRSVSASIRAILETDFHSASIFGLGLQGDISISTTNAEAITVSQSCPPGFTCGLQAIAHKWNVTGWEMTYYPDQGGNYICEKRTTWQKYEVHFPMLQPNAQPNAQGFVEYSICISMSLYHPPSIDHPANICPKSTILSTCIGDRCRSLCALRCQITLVLGSIMLERDRIIPQWSLQQNRLGDIKG
jgi:hypothetical protein